MTAVVTRQLRIHLPAAYHDLPVGEISMPMWVRRSLGKGGIETLADLEGAILTDLSVTAGIGSSGIAELLEALRWMTVSLGPSWPLLKDHPLAEMACDPDLRRVLARRGARTLGEVAALLEVDPRARGPEVRALLRQVSLLAETPAAIAQAMSRRTDPYRLPKLPLTTLGAIASATTVIEEVVALLTDDDPRVGPMVLHRWAADPPATFREIAEPFALTAERARQIVGAKESVIANSGLVLPLASGAVRRRPTSGEEGLGPLFAALRRLGLV